MLRLFQDLTCKRELVYHLQYNFQLELNPILFSGSIESKSLENQSTKHLINMVDSHVIFLLSELCYAMPFESENQTNCDLVTSCWVLTVEIMRQLISFFLSNTSHDQWSIFDCPQKPVTWQKLMIKANFLFVQQQWF